MYKELCHIMVCPKCGESLNLIVKKSEGEEILEGELYCNNHHWHIREGIINFESEEQDFANNWTESYKNNTYKEIDEKILKGTPENLKKLNNETKDYIINTINNPRNKYILDVATGRGMLLMELVKYMNPSIHLICTDLSFQVLLYDRLKVQKINPNLKVSYIACDATNLPIKEKSIDTVISFYGISNMMDKMEEGLIETNRILKGGSLLLNSSFVIKNDSLGFKAMEEYLKENNILNCAENLIENGIKVAHKKAGFKAVNMRVIGESTGEKCEFDLIPYEGEWFSVVVMECEK